MVIIGKEYYGLQAWMMAKAYIVQSLGKVYISGGLPKIFKQQFLKSYSPTSGLCYSSRSLGDGRSVAILRNKLFTLSIKVPVY